MRGPIFRNHQIMTNNFVYFSHGTISADKRYFLPMLTWSVHCQVGYLNHQRHLYQCNRWIASNTIYDLLH